MATSGLEEAISPPPPPPSPWCDPFQSISMHFFISLAGDSMNKPAAARLIE